MRNRVDDAGKTQPEGRNSQDAWAIYKNHMTGERDEAMRQNDDRPWKNKKETYRGDSRAKRKPENETKQRNPAKNATWSTKRGRGRRQGQGAGITRRAPAQKNGTQETQRANRIHLSNEKGSRPEKTGVYPRRRPENAAGN